MLIWKYAYHEQSQTKKYKMRKFNSLICILRVTFIGTSLFLTNIIINKPTNVILYI